MTLGTWVWSNKFTGSISVPVFPTVNPADMLTVPPNLVTALDTGSVLVIAYAFWDPTLTFQRSGTLQHSIGISYIDSVTSTEYVLTSPSLGGISVGGTDLALANAGVIVAGQTIIGGTVQHPPVTALANGGTIHYRASADSSSVTARMSLCAALLQAGGKYSGVTADQPILVSLNTSAGTYSGTITTSPAADGRINVAFVAAGASVNNFSGASAPDYALAANWLNLQTSVVDSAIYSGIGYLSAISDPITTDAYSVSIPAADFGAGNFIFALSPAIAAGGGSAQVIG